MSSRHSKASHKGSKTGEPKDPGYEEGVKSYKKINIPELPIITLNSGPNIPQIRDAIIRYCQRELGSIASIFTEGKYRAPATAIFDYSEIEADKTGIKKDQALSKLKRIDADNDKYEKSKLKLHGILSGMTTREVDEKIADHRDSLKRNETDEPSLQAAPLKKHDMARVQKLQLEEQECPLSLWKCIMHVTTTRTIGNAKVDQNNLAINFANIRQKTGESVSDFKRRLSNMLDSFDAIKMERPSDSLIAMRFLHGLEDARYGSLKTYLGNELANGRDLYQSDLDGAASQATRWLVPNAKSSNTLSTPIAVNTFITDAATPKKRSKQVDKKPKSEEKSPPSDEVCEFCSRKGHSQAKCFQYSKARKAAAAEAATKKDKFSKKPFPLVSGAMLATKEDDSDDDIPIHKLAYHSISLILGRTKQLSPYDIVLDTGANGSIVHNKALLHEIKTQSPLTFSGLAGALTTTTVGAIRDLGNAHYHQNSPANILSFSQLRDAGHNIQFEKVDDIDTFTVTTQDFVYHFKERGAGLYVCDLKPIKTALVSTVYDNASQHSKREVAQALAARELQERMAHPPDNKLKEALTYGNIIYSKVSPADIARAQSIYGPNTSALQGKTTFKTTEPFPTPQESLRDTTPQQLYADIFLANGVSFFITVAKPLEHIIASPIDTRETSSLRRAVHHHLSCYSQRRIATPTIYSDNERGLAALAPELATMGIQLIHSGPGMHVHVVERAIRYVKEGVRSIHAGLPYKCPRALFRLLIPFVALRLNMFPTSTRTDRLSAFQVIYNRPADARRDCHLTFGAMYHVTCRDRAHSMAPRTVAAIGIAQVPNGTGTCSFFTIHNHTIISANHFTAVPMTPDMIHHINRLAADDKASTAIDAPYYLHGKPLLGPPPIDSSPLLPSSREPAATTIAPAPTQEPPAPEQPIEDVSNEDIVTEVPLEPEAPLAEYTVSEGDPVSHGVNQHPVSDTTNTAESTLELHDHQQPEPPTNNDHIDEAVPTEDSQPALPALPQPSAAPSRPTRDRRPPDRLNLLSTFHMTAKRALREDPTTARPAIEAELKTLIGKGVFRPVKLTSLTTAQRVGIIRSQLNVTQKYLPTTDGAGRIKDKVKARLVGGGDCQDRTQYSASETSSPTVSTTSIFLIAQIAANEGRDVTTIDIGSAYLNASMPKTNPSKLVFMRISKEVSEIMVGIDKNFARFTHTDGTLVVELDKALYGCIESALLWYKELTRFLTKIGFKANPYDICVMNRVTKTGLATIGIYVDDILLTCSHPSIADKIIQDLEDEYKQLKITRGATHNYLGMVMDFSHKGVVKVSQAGMVEEITRAPGVAALKEAVGPTDDNPKTPCTEMLFKSSEDSPALTTALAKIVHSITARILFVANRGRPDLLPFISFMTKRVLHPTHEDGRKLLRALQYLARTSQLDLTLGYAGTPTISVYIDASFGVHQDRKSHTGVFVTLGTGALYTKSTTQRINTTSSCEAELVAISKGLQQSLWARSFMAHQGFTMPPLIVYQDNQSTVKLLQRGRPAAEQTRHIEIGYFWLSDLILRGIITITYCPTHIMVADFFTKPLQGTLFSTMRNCVLGTTPITPP